jgi:pectin methylesterase-like acyl-CoA thioesterase
VVAPDGTGDYRTVQEAVDAAPADGSIIRIRPGVYRQVVNKNAPSSNFTAWDPRPPMSC